MDIEQLLEKGNEEEIGEAIRKLENKLNLMQSEQRDGLTKEPRKKINLKVKMIKAPERVAESENEELPYFNNGVTQYTDKQMRDIFGFKPEKSLMEKITDAIELSGMDVSTQSNSDYSACSIIDATNGELKDYGELEEMLEKYKDIFHTDIKDLFKIGETITPELRDAYIELFQKITLSFERGFIAGFYNKNKEE